MTKNTTDITDVKAVAKALALLTDRFDAGELKPRQFEMVARELMRTTVYAHKLTLHAD